MRIAHRIQQLAESATLAVSAKAAKMKAEGIDVISLAAGEPDFDTPEHIKEVAIQALRNGETKYPKPASGLPAAKQAACEKLKRVNGLDYDPSQIIITAGAKNAVHMTFMSLLNPGDEVILPVPYWVSYPEQIKLAGAVPVFVHGDEVHGFEITVGQLEGAVTEKTRMLVLNSPSNPGGFTYSPHKIREIAEFIRGRDIIVLSDEIYDQLVYEGAEHLSIAATGEDAYAKTVTVSGGSKTYAMTGWRIGYAAGPPAVIKAMAKLQSQRTSGAATFTQLALVEALTGDQSCVKDMRTEFAKRAAHMHQRLCAMPGISCVQPTGAFYTFPNCLGSYERLGVSGSIAFAQRLLEEAHVAVVPGIAFGNDAHVRVSFATSMERIDAGLDRMERWLKS
ncbi:MAG: pyridoxal phosphate-dependent aminotransferase [bacterium]|nr:pyridoxal phosphate-dependent aminotransferase [bacterium]